MSQRTTGVSLGVASLLIAGAALLLADGGRFRNSPHGSAESGVWRTGDYPRGSCLQCHGAHQGGTPEPFGLFQPNSNELCLGASMGGCHADQPSGATAGYPAQETDRMPIGSSDAGYFEFNSGGTRIPGVSNHVRWPGRQVWKDLAYSPHNTDPDMPLKDFFGDGDCGNCHNIHGGAGSHDLLDTTYSSIVGSQFGAWPDNYELCFSCHSQFGPVGMNESGKRIRDYYDRSINPSNRAGHGIGDGGGYVPSGARLSCSDCHNPHGSRGSQAGGPNAFLLSDQRPGWHGLTDIRNDNAQVRRFCFGCHVSSDNQAGGTIHGLNLERLPDEVAAHEFMGTTHCYDCHGRDYSTSNGFNVHNPAEGE